MQETQVRFLCREDALENEMATYSSVLGLENPMDRGAWQTTAHKVAKVGHGLVTKPSPSKRIAYNYVHLAKANKIANYNLMSQSKYWFF